MEDILTAAEAAELLSRRGVRVSARTLLRWAAAGKIPVIVLAGRKLFRAEDLEDLLTPVRLGGDVGGADGA